MSHQSAVESALSVTDYIGPRQLDRLESRYCNDREVLYILRNLRVHQTSTTRKWTTCGCEL